MALTKVNRGGLNTGISDSSDATAITIDSSEKVGIGQTTPVRRLHIKDTSADMYIGLEGGTSNNVGILMGDTDNHTLSRIRHDNSDNALEFHTNETERMRIDTNGNVGIGTNSPGSFNVNADNLVVGTTSGENGITIATGTGNSARFVFSDNNNNSNDAFVGAIEYSHGSDNMIFYNGGSQRMVLADNGNVTNSTGSYGTISDETLKENISDASSQWDDIKAIQVRKYSMKADDLDSADKIGVIAQELEKSGMNGLVEETEWTDKDDILKKDKIKTVKYSILYMKAIKALQEAMTRIETLEAEVKALKG